MKQHAASSSPFSFCNITTFSDGSSRCFSHQARQKLHPRTVTTSRFTSELAETLCHSDLSPWFHRAFIVLSQLLLTENKPQKQTSDVFSTQSWTHTVFQYLAAQFERVDLLPLLGQGLIHATKVVAHHAQLVFVAPLRRSQLILRERPWRHLCSTAADVSRTSLQIYL